MKYRYLSHAFTSNIPTYGGYASLAIDSVKSITCGDPTNIFSFTMQNHWGTHVDCPAHFFENGRKIMDYLPEYWHFRHPQVIHVSLKPAELLHRGDLVERIDYNTDLLLLRSGWFKLRDSDKYSLENPGIHPDTGFLLREKYPHIRAIGIDWISISSYKNRELGREAHRAFLNPEGVNNPIAIVEDMNLSYDLTALAEVWVVPLRIEMIDSAPCTIIGVFND